MPLRVPALSVKNPARLPPKSVNLGMFSDGTYSVTKINGGCSRRNGY